MVRDAAKLGNKKGIGRSVDEGRNKRMVKIEDWIGGCGDKE